MIYNSELVEKVSYGSEFGNFGVIEEIDIREKFVDTVLRIKFKDGEHGLMVSDADPNYILCKHGLFRVSDAIVNEGDYIQYNDEYAKVIEEGVFNIEMKEFEKKYNSNSVKVLLDSGDEIVIMQSNMEGRYTAYNLRTKEFNAIESEIVFDSAEKAVKMYTKEMDSSISDGSINFDFDDWE